CFLSELGVFAPWREEFPNPRIFDSRNIKAARYDKHVGVSFGIAIRTARRFRMIKIPNFVLFVVTTIFASSIAA
ncbi:MAG TPA: hypothetical protein VLM90_01380, partial [Candidatus Deferrimicrobium sp.]|nr:hypothetical protein [Candidatus Deferrimicrobium sp.]